jgi:hypothetical protein
VNAVSLFERFRLRIPIIWTKLFRFRVSITQRKDPAERDICVLSSQKIVLLEHNYLLLDENPWKAIQGFVDET